MKMRAKNVAWLLPFFLTGCFHFHKAQQQQAQSLAPTASTEPKPAPAHPDLPDSAVTIPPQPVKTNADAVEVAPKSPPRHKKSPPKNTQQAAVTPPSTPVTENPAVSAIGQLSSGDPSDQRRQTEDSIAATERGLNGLGTNLNDQEQKTAAQIRAYLKHAKDALNSGDVDGAITLAAKAKAVLSELLH
ncbi:MAG: hypothetical protein ABSG96_16240 [Terracidiphilus sp.]|jgi:hypothetical protein